MASESRDSTVKTHEEILARIRGLTAGIRDGAAAAEEARAFEVDRRFPNIDIVVTSGVLPVEHLPANAKFIAKPWRGQSRPQESEQDDKWSFCLTAGTLCPANQERQ